MWIGRANEIGEATSDHRRPAAGALPEGLFYQIKLYLQPHLRRKLA
jgi:hypothetical protein